MDYKELIVWQKSMDLVEKVYFLTKKFPKDEIYGLYSQMRRSAISIPSNIAEGSRRGGVEYQRFLRIAFGSASELETQTEISRKLEYLSQAGYADINSLVVQILKMLNKMIQYKA